MKTRAPTVKSPDIASFIDNDCICLDIPFSSSSSCQRAAIMTKFTEARRRPKMDKRRLFLTNKFYQFRCLAPLLSRESNRGAEKKNAQQSFIISVQVGYQWNVLASSRPSAIAIETTDGKCPVDISRIDIKRHLLALLSLDAHLLSRHICHDPPPPTAARGWSRPMFTKQSIIKKGGDKEKAFLIPKCADQSRMCVEEMDDVSYPSIQVYTSHS